MQIGFYSWETIALRCLMIASGTCTFAEFERMVREKMTAAFGSAVALGSGDAGSLLQPWYITVRGNAERLRER